MFKLRAMIHKNEFRQMDSFLPFISLIIHKFPFTWFPLDERVFHSFPLCIQSQCIFFPFISPFIIISLQIISICHLLSLFKLWKMVFKVTRFDIISAWRGAIKGALYTYLNPLKHTWIIFKYDKQGFIRTVTIAIFLGNADIKVEQIIYPPICCGI